MSDLPPFGTSSPFVRAIVQSAHGDAPAPGAKARVLSHLASTAKVSVAVAAANGAVRASFSMWNVLAAAAAMAAVAGAGWQFAEHARSQGPEGHPPLVAEAESSPVSAPSLALPSRAPAPTLHGPAVSPGSTSQCESVTVPDHEPTTCSARGNLEALEVHNNCGEVVDVFWVDFQCRETFAGRLGPGETFQQRTYDTHPWRVRDHATHRLLKEWVGPKSSADADDPPSVLPDIIVRDDSTAPDGPPLACSRPSHKASLTIRNERTHGVSVVFWVDGDCHEGVYARLDPGQTWTQSTFEAHPWRVRDESGALLVDFVSGGPDETVYVDVP